MIPIEHNMYRYTDLIDGTLTLEDVALCNDRVYVKRMNEDRAAELARANRGN